MLKNLFTNKTKPLQKYAQRKNARRKKAQRKNVRQKNVLRKSVRLHYIRDMHILYRQRRSRQSKPVWLTKDIHRAIQSNSTAFKKLKNAPLETNTKAYRIARNKVKREIRASKRAKELELVRHCNKDSKKKNQIL